MPEHKNIRPPDARAQAARKGRNLIPRLFIVCAALTFFVVACAERESLPPSSPKADTTGTFFKQNCAVCHGANGEGQMIGSGRVPSLRDGRAAAATDEELYAQIAHGGNGMPPFKYQLGDKQIKRLVDYIRREFQGKSGVAADARRP